MKNLKRHYFKILIILISLSYLITVRTLKLSNSIFYLTVSLIFVISIILFLGNVVGAIGIFYQQFTGKDAINFYEKAYKLNATNPTILMAYSLSLLSKKEYKKAIEVSEKGLDESYYFAVSKTLMVYKGLALFKLGEIDEAINIYLDVLKKFGKENQQYFQDDLETPSKTMIAENPYFNTADLSTLGYFYIIKGDYERARFFSIIALKKDSKFAAAFDNLGRIAYLKGESEKAIKDFNEALSINKNLVDSLFYLSKIYFEKGDMEKSKEYFNKINKTKLNGLSMLESEEIEEFENKLK